LGARTILIRDTLTDLYGPEYYKHGCGQIPYERSAHWLNFFGIVADQLIRSLHPRRVFDAGCAMGFLVESFWTRGVHSEGVDLSEYAISQVRSDIQEYCKTKSILEPIEGSFDLVTCIEVLEHLPPHDAQKAIANLCSAAPCVFFSSTPDDFVEPTHVNVRPTIYWLQLFAEFDFWPDARFDCSFLAPHAMLLRKGKPPQDDLLVLYSEWLRYKGALEQRTVSFQSTQAELARAEVDKQALETEMTAKLTAVAAEAEREKQAVQTNLNEAVARAEQAEQERLTIVAVLASLKEESEAARTDLSALKTQLTESRIRAASVERELVRHTDQQRQASESSHAELTAAVAQRNDLLQKIGVLGREVATVSRERAESQAIVHAVLSSRAWRLAEKCRTPLRKIRRDWPAVARVISYIPRRFLVSGKRAAAGTPSSAENTDANPASVFVVSVPPSVHLAVEPAYQRWIDEQEPSAVELDRQRVDVLSLTGPIISVVVPAYQPVPAFFQACVQSVLSQTYSRWQLCIAFSPGGDAGNLPYIRSLAASDPRIKLLELDGNLGISGNTNAALAVATGDYVAFLDHDDTLPSFALFEVACRIQTDPSADVLYSDHDYLDANGGQRCNPLFKPDWSPEIMLSANYITHLTVLRRSLLNEIGHLNSDTDGAQDWDLYFRATEHASQVVHIPKVLYHWRMHAGSTAHNDSAKNYAANAQLRAISSHLARTGMEGDPEVMSDGLLHVRFRRPVDSLVTIIIPTRDRIDLLSRALSTLLTHTHYPHYEILIVDTGSREKATADYFESLKSDSRVRIIWHPGPFNFSAANNEAARHAQGELFLFLNNDVEITSPHWLDELANWASYTPIGIVGAKLLRANGLIQHAGVVLGLGGFADHPFADQASLTFGLAGSTGWYRNFLAVTGACMMVRRSVFEEIGGFDENFVLCGSDVEICLRARRFGYRVVYNPFAAMIHHEQQTRGTDVPPIDFVESIKHYRHWLLAGDPFWSKNLSSWNKQPAFRYLGEPPSLEFAERHVEAVKPQIPVADQRVRSEAEWLALWFDCDEEGFRRLREQQAAMTNFHRVKRVLWFIPAFEMAFYGGIFTILRFAESWNRQEGVTNLFAICGSADHSVMANRIRMVYPALANSDITVLDNIASASQLPQVDASICTLWTTAYYALRHREVGRRFYFIQDFEPAFYPAGSTSALVESTYRMGLYGIANTVSLKKMYESEYGGKATYFKPCINPSVFFPPPAGKRHNVEGPWTVFMYGRPGHPRNSFELLSQAARLLKQRLGDHVRIVSAGSDWNPAHHGLQGIVENLGVLAYEDSAKLYRQTDLGLVMMLTRHPSYIPLELMACGSLVVTNISSWTAWLLKDGENCLLTYPTASAIADTIQRALLNFDLRSKITDQALQQVMSGYLDWDTQMAKIYGYLCDPQPCEERETNLSPGELALQPLARFVAV
jgi:O-antigen biosynthesis protein